VFTYSSQRRCWSMQPLVAGISRRLGERARDEAGVTLLELLVVVLIVGILAALAIPSLAGQKGKAVDAQAKTLARTAETTAESIATNDKGEYGNVTAAELNAYEPTIRILPSSTAAYLSGATGGQANFSLTAKATNGDEFTISRNAGGEVTRTCLSPVAKTGCGGAEKGSW